MAKQGNKKKIAIVGYRLAKGGLERVFSSVSHLLHDADCDVHVFVLEDDVQYSYSGKLINLGHYSKFQKYFQLRRLLKINQFDYVIDFRHRINPWMEMVFLQFIYANFKTIYTIHSSKLSVYLTDKAWVARQILKKAFKIVPVSNALNKKLINDFIFDKGVVISNSLVDNALEMEVDQITLPFKYCIAVGRLVALKQIDKLIEIYAQSDLPRNKIHLVVLGEGEEQKQLDRLILELQLTEFIHLLGFKNDASNYIKKAEFLVLTSQYEGFSMVILESLTSGTPVISFDCESGPREMIVNEVNGLLVDDQNFDELKTAMNRMILDQTMYDFCKSNAKNSVMQFSSKNIQKKWLDLLQINSN